MGINGSISGKETPCAWPLSFRTSASQTEEELEAARSTAPGWHFSFFVVSFDLFGLLCCWRVLFSLETHLEFTWNI